jgi:NAD(P)-dependent dehydrogenase (short-subunit alcohol dehydrogenase family)
MTEEERQRGAQELSIKRWGKPEEVAKVSACITSDHLSFVTGNSIVIDGASIMS